MPQAAPGAQSTTLRDLLTEQATALGIPPDLALAIVAQESGGRQDATSPKGALGLFQLMPETAAELGVDPTDPVQNITGGLRYFKRQLDAHDGDVRLALAAYNAGPGAVAEAGGIPDFPETQEYVTRVLEGWQQGTVEVEVPEPTRTLSEDVRDVAQQTLPVAGMLIGGVKGAAMGAPAGPVGAFVGAVAGAGVGGLGGEAVFQGLTYLGEKLGIVTPRERTGEEVVSELLESANEGMQFEAFGRGVVGMLTPIAKKLFQPFRGQLTKYADDAFREFPPNEGQAFLPSEISESRALNIGENIASGSIFGGKSTAHVRATREALAAGKTTVTLGRLGPAVPEAHAATQAGKTATRSINDAINAFRGEEGPAWRAVRQLADPIPLQQTPETTAFVAQLTGREAGALAPNAGVRAAQRVADLVGDTAMADLPESVQMAVRQALAAQGGTAAQISAGQFTKTVSDLGKLERALKVAASRDPSKYNSQLGIVKKLLTTTKADLRATLQHASEPALAAYEKATLISKLGNDRLYNKAVLDVVNKSPAQVAGLLLQKNNSEAIGLVTKAVGESNMQPLRRVALEKIIQPDAVTGQISWPRVARQLQSVGDDTLTALFPKGQAAEIRSLTRLMNQLAAVPAGGIGKVGIMLTQWGPLAGAGGAIAAGQLPGGAGILLTPWMIARIMSSRAGAQYLSRGISAPLGSQAAVRTSVYLTRLLYQQLEETPEGERARADAAEAAIAPIPRSDDLLAP